jgi:hypothetical protein
MKSVFFDESKQMKRALGTHRFQRAVSASRPIAFQCASCHYCTLEAMRTQARAAQCRLQWFFICTVFK